MTEGVLEYLSNIRSEPHGHISWCHFYKQATAEQPLPSFSYIQLKKGLSHSITSPSAYNCIVEVNKECRKASHPPVCDTKQLAFLLLVYRANLQPIQRVYSARHIYSRRCVSRSYGNTTEVANQLSMVPAVLNIYLPETSEYKLFIYQRHQSISNPWFVSGVTSRNKVKSLSTCACAHQRTICDYVFSFHMFHFLPCLRCNISNMERCTENTLKLI
jgi:hypothetical protein